MQDQIERIRAYGKASATSVEKAIDANAQVIVQVVRTVCSSIRNQGKVLFFGNGGSAADAQHLAAEFINRYLFDRDALAALALTTDTSVITSISNDYEYENIFSRQVAALANKQDVAVGISTSGTSKNVLLGLEAARKIGCATVGMCGSNTDAISPFCDHILAVNDPSTPLVQQAHITMGHILCELIESRLFDREEG